MAQNSTVLTILTAGRLDFTGCAQHEWSLGSSGTDKAEWGALEHLSARSEALSENAAVLLPPLQRFSSHRGSRLER